MVQKGKTVRVVVLGGGFGGLYCTLYLAEELKEERGVEILLVSDTNFFLFAPLLHEVATGTIETRHIIQPIRAARGLRPFRFIQAEIEAIDLAGRTVIANGTSYSYDYLVLALGSRIHTYNIPGVEEHAFSLKTLRDSIRLRNHVLDMFERAEAEEDKEVRRQLLAFVVVGAGPIGVEYITDLADIIRQVLLKHYRGIEPQEVSLFLIQATNRILPEMDEDLVRYAEATIARKGIQVRLNSPVVRVEADGVVLKDGGPKIRAGTVVWAGGVKANPLVAQLPVEHDRLGRVVVDETLTIPGYPGVCAIGDNALSRDARTGRPLPMLGQVALHQGVRVAGNIVNEIHGRPPEPLEYTYLGYLLSLGHQVAIVNILGIKFRGFIGWLIFRLLYLGKLVGFSKKVRVALDWLLALCFEIDISQLKVR